MKYYVYFDAYGNALKVIDEAALKKEYEGDTGKFLEAMSGDSCNAETERATGHVGTLNFKDQEELTEFLDSLGDEVTGFYNCGYDSRLYNF